ncbi:hypothetical protein TWF696_009881 [Orbilia brochopaga]|uniref:Pre-rRNA processing protein n=1 Tax=Orbilia brochopaga TaxID=3140254 RepID=A0AAV9UE38_9PEZI
MAAASAPFPSYGATSSPPASASAFHLDDDSDRTLANTPLRPKSTSSLNNDDDSDGYGYGSRHVYNDFQTERSPLIPAADAGLQTPSDPAVGARTDHERGKQRQHFPLALLMALGLLCSLMVLILFLGFFLPEAAQKYAKEAAQVQLSSLSVDSFTANAVRVRVQARVAIDAARVDAPLSRRLGILVGSVARKIRIGSSEATLYLPDYPDGLLGTASFPDFSINLGNGQLTDIDIICEVVPGSIDGIKPALGDYLAGQIHSLRVQVESDVPLSSGIIALGTHKIVEEVILKDIPGLPTAELSRLNLAEVELPEQKALGANVTVSVNNGYPINLEVPALSFSVLLLSCDQQFVEVAVARTSAIEIRPYEPIVADVKGLIKSIPFALIETCPGTGTSPLDDLLGQYVRGHSATAYIRGLPSDDKDSGVPAWLEEFLTSVTIPVPFPGGHAFKDIVKSFSLRDVDFQFPEPSADPDGPDSPPIISATVQAIIQLPQEVNALLDVSKILANADILYHGKKLGEFHVPNWAPATTIQHQKQHELEIIARVERVPLNVTDAEVLSEVVRKIYFGGGGGVKLQAVGTADVNVKLASLGAFVIRGIPAQGDIVVKGGNFTLDDIHPRPKGITVLSSTKRSVKLRANVMFHNPTNYTATVPYFNIAFMKNGTVLGNGTVRNLVVGLGRNHAMVEAFWAPSDGGDTARATGVRLLNKYVSGKNTSLTVRAHGKSLPALPELSKALGSLEIDIPLPSIPSDNDPDSPNNHHFVQSATLHVSSSTGTFVLRNPLAKDTIFLSNLTGVAFHNGTILGTLNYTYQFAIPPGISETPKLPVEWSLDGVGYDIVRKAIWGVLDIDAKAQCNIKLGNWEEKLSFEGSGIGAHVKL